MLFLLRFFESKNNKIKSEIVHYFQFLFFILIWTKFPKPSIFQYISSSIR